MKATLQPALLAAGMLWATTSYAAAQWSLPWPPVATFSILGYDSTTGEVGGAVQSRVFAVGNGVLWAEADVGLVATQAIVDGAMDPKRWPTCAKASRPPTWCDACWRTIRTRGPRTGRRRGASSP